MRTPVDYQLFLHMIFSLSTAFYIIFLTIFSFPLVTSDEIFITQPDSHTTCYIGDRCRVEWHTFESDTPHNSIFDIHLLSSGFDDIFTTGIIALNVNLDNFYEEYFIFDIPSNFLYTGIHLIGFYSVESDYVTYSSAFKIVNLSLSQAMIP